MVINELLLNGAIEAFRMGVHLRRLWVGFEAFISNIPARMDTGFGSSDTPPGQIRLLLALVCKN